jgi:cohesin complex subunit SA-1/2
VKSLQSLYAKSDYLITIQHFTERFKPRLISIATSDADLSVRVAVIHVLRAIDSAGLLDEDQRSALCLLIFDDEARVRKAISAFVKGIWEEALKERLVGRDEEDDSPVVKLSSAKALASLLVAWDRTLEKHNDDGESSSNQDGEHERGSQQQTPAVVNSMPKGRTSLAVEALWDEVDAVRDWQTLLDILILDHSSSASCVKGGHPEAPSSTYKMRGKKGKSASSPNKSRGRAGQNTSGANEADDDVVDEAWRLEDDEERALVDVLIACLQKTLADEAAKKAVCDAHKFCGSPLLNEYAGRSRFCAGRHYSRFDQDAPTAVHQASNRHIPHD